jgi:undecaprenyl-diphosphatase
MVGAFTLDLVKNHGQMTSGNVLLVAVGFACSFIAGFLVVKTFLDYVSRHGFALFAWWRVIVGSIGLVLLAVGR